MIDRIVSWAEQKIRMPVIGIDMSDRSIKHMKFASGSPIVCEIFGESQVPEGAMVSGEIKRGGVVASVLRDLKEVKKPYFREAGIVASLPEEKSFLRAFQLSGVKQEDFRNAIRWEMEKQIPIPIDELIFDYEVMDPSGAPADHTDVVVTAFPRRLVESYAAVFAEAGLQPIAFELESQAIVRASLAHLRGQSARIIIDMGRTRTSLILAARGGIVFTTTIAVGGELLEENLSKVLEIDHEEAVRIKKEVGLAKHARDGRIFAALIPVLDALADQLTRTIEFYRQDAERRREGGSEIATLLLSGGDANLKGLDTYLASATGLPCFAIDPFAALRPGMDGAIPPIPRPHALAFTAAIGLAIRGRV